MITPLPEFKPPDHYARRALASRLLAKLIGGKAGANRLGELVRKAWVDWAEGQVNPKPSWLVPWADLEQDQRDADTLIGIEIARYTIHWFIRQFDINGELPRMFTDDELRAIIAIADQKEAKE